VNARVIDEFEIWAKIFRIESEDMGSELARMILQLRIPADVQSRVDELATENNCHGLPDQEFRELETYVRIGTILSTLKSRARLALKRLESKSS